MDHESLEIDARTLARMRQAGEPVTVLDVREPQELAICTLDDSLHIPMTGIPDRLDRIPAEGPVIVMCHHGIRSMQVTRFLHHMGYTNARNLAGGIDAWARDVEPGMARY